MSFPGDGNARVVAGHYNARPQVNRFQRQRSPIFHLKNFNNWVKSCLIRTYCKPGDNVLDFCCGKGGDLQKWDKSRIASLVGVDIADVSIQHAQQRCAESPPQFRYRFIVKDAFKDELFAKDSDLGPFDLVSCQFSLHYSFETEKQARQAMRNVSSRLREGGHFIGTIPNAYRLVKKLFETPDGAFGNSIYSVKFAQRYESEKSIPTFGAKYTFHLEDAIDSCPEYLIPMNVLELIAREYGLELVYNKEFLNFYEEKHKESEPRHLLDRMKVVNSEGTMAEDEWRVADLYLAFAFVKRSAGSLAT
ncbi:putative mRNA cap guanine-N7 methyltransferase [Polychytrium aggregatum]|uniref:putative mRNA cap guanine-N7 methyltransferase n=1 Tax=Polychytrium aggregatum TaxID=110093 RepID=UPI0022FEC7F9|nr:putative mRNA cap guanine-N7 methyltransferase [Polychytrium aggregatum]KAI9202760.1 putative mRNA cap guanine-N7 methyltransferase [Polychytrium aggregatum]